MSSSLPSLDLGASAPLQQTGAGAATNNDLGASLNQSLSGSASKLRPMTSDTSGAGTRGARTGGSAGGENRDLRKMWQLALRLCHKADPDRTGQVNRVAFIQALETANPENVSSSC